jgi:hypothetical protein
MMQMSRRRDGDGLDSALEQRIHVGESRAAEGAADEFALPAIGIGDPHQLHAGHLREHACMVAAHDADADHPDPQSILRAQLVTLTTHDPESPEGPPPTQPAAPLACLRPTGDHSSAGL